MSLFDFFFPEQAQAAHLRRVADNSSRSQTQARLAQARTTRTNLDLSKRVGELEGEVAELTIILEAVLECASEDGSLTRAALARKVAEIDARDGVIDGRITKPGEQKDTAPEPKAGPNFNFPKE